jgi:hypothetical protein
MRYMALDLFALNTGVEPAAYLLSFVGLWVFVFMVATGFISGVVAYIVGKTNEKHGFSEYPW